MKKIILSYDYELYFGDKSGTVQKSIIEPTYKLLDAMESVGFKGNFFVDWQMIKYIGQEKDAQAKADYQSLIIQVQDIVRRGHRVELHIHPHWVDAQYLGNGWWDFSDFKHYCLNSFTIEQINDIFVEGVNLLESIARTVDPQYKIIAFRAGGWAVQPFSLLKDAFRKTGIKIDSSVMENHGIVTDYSECHFEDVVAPPCGYYWFDDDVIEIKRKGEFLELPIAAYVRPFLYKVINKICSYYPHNYSSLTDGTHLRSKDNPDKWINPYNLQVFTFGNALPLVAIARQLLGARHDYTCYIEHPKDFSKHSAGAIKALGLVCKSATYWDLYKNIFKI